MDLKKLAHLLIALGCILTMAAVIWWAHYFGPIVDGMHSSLGKALDCLYSRDGMCALASGVSQLFGKSPYNPAIFWTGIGILSAGIVIRLTLKNGKP